MKKAIIIVAAFLCLFVWVTFRHPSRKPLGLVGPAPEFTLTDLANHPLNLSGLRGKVVVLDFWATWCGPCREEIPHFIALQSKYEPRLQVVGISMDDEEKPVREFQQQFKMNYPVAMGNPKVAEQYGGILGLPITFIIDRNGQIFARHLGATNVSVIEDEIQKLLMQPPS